MSRTLDALRHPGRVLAEMIARAARGDDRHRRSTWRAVVLAVDTEGGLLENPQGAGSIKVVDRSGRTVEYPARIGPANPRGSVKARILTDGLDRLLDDGDLRTFWPMSPADQVGMPVSPGEHVYVTFEDTEDGSMEHGLWTSRVSGHDSANSFAGTDSYTAPSGQGSAVDAFSPSDPGYQRTDEAAGLAPSSAGHSTTTDATKFFGGS